MIRDPSPDTDAIGRSRTKKCPECTAEIGRTLQKCPECGHEFVGKDRARKLRNSEQPKVVK
jgi:predicted RNA-binding Zn-ribbon protein involved in translation (DUF1610 family)